MVKRKLRTSCLFRHSKVRNAKFPVFWKEWSFKFANRNIDLGIPQPWKKIIFDKGVKIAHYFPVSTPEYANGSLNAVFRPPFISDFQWY
jgi:hypothetical protein